jgi:hypothetical protein
MFRTTSCSSSGESILWTQHLVCVTLCRWPSITQVPTCILDVHLHRVTYQILYWYNWFSWWWARGCSKHVENWNKYIEKRIVRQVGHIQELYWDTRSTEHKITAMNVVRFSSVTVQYFRTVNAATLFPYSLFLFDFNLIKFEGDIAVSTSGRMGSILVHRPTLCYCIFCTLHIEPKWNIQIRHGFSMPCSRYVMFYIEKYAVRVRFDGVTFRTNVLEIASLVRKLKEGMVNVKCTLVQALRLCTGSTARRGVQV